MKDSIKIKRYPIIHGFLPNLNETRHINEKLSYFFIKSFDLINKYVFYFKKSYIKLIVLGKIFAPKDNPGIKNTPASATLRIEPK